MLDSKRLVFERDRGICQYCGDPVSLSGAVFHHRLNRCMGGGGATDNLETRHPRCENEAHYLFHHGNPCDGAIDPVYYRIKQQKHHNPRKRRENRKRLQRLVYRRA